MGLSLTPYNSLQRDCELVSCIGGQSIVAMTHGPSHGMFQKKAVIAGDETRCHGREGGYIYACPAPGNGFFIRFSSSFRTHCILVSHPPTHPRLYIVLFLCSRLFMDVQTWEGFFLGAECTRIIVCSGLFIRCY